MIVFISSTMSTVTNNSDSWVNFLFRFSDYYLALMDPEFVMDPHQAKSQTKDQKLKSFVIGNQNYKEAVCFNLLKFLSWANT